MQDIKWLLKSVMGLLFFGMLLQSNLRAEAAQNEKLQTKVIQGSDGATIQIEEDGSKLIKKADGTTIQIKSDGTKIIKKSDGTHIEIKPNSESRDIKN